MFAVPTSIRVTGCTVEFPTVKFPKLTLVELGESWDVCPVCAAIPVPDNMRFKVEFEASLDIDKVPCTLPKPFGTKSTVIATDWFGVNVTFDPPLALNPLPVTDTPEIAMFEVPSFISVTGCEAVFPTCRFPKLTLVELGESCDPSG
jgi:hypothetical protein